MAWFIAPQLAKLKESEAQLDGLKLVNTELMKTFRHCAIKRLLTLREHQRVLIETVEQENAKFCDCVAAKTLKESVSVTKQITSLAIIVSVLLKLLCFSRLDG